MKRMILNLFLLCSIGLTQPQKDLVLERFELIGVEQVSMSKARSWTHLKTGMPFDESRAFDAAKALLQVYAEQGMPYTRVDSMRYQTETNKVILSMYITEGEMLRWGEIHLQGADSAVVEKLYERIETRPGESLNNASFHAGMMDGVRYLTQRGYPFGQIELQNVTLDTSQQDEKRLDVAVELYTGPKMVINDIQIEGNTITQAYVIERELGIKTGDLYHQDKVDRIPDRLMRTGYFSRVDPPRVFYTQGNEGGLLLSLQEGPSSRFDGVIGYNPGTEQEKGYFTGLLDISLGNLFGTGRALQVHWQKRDRKTQELEFHYREPWVAGWPVHVGFGFEQLIQDTTYVQRELGLDIAMPLWENFTGLARFSRQSISPDSLSSYLFGIPHSNTLAATAGFSYDSRDDLINPRRGVYYKTTLSAGQKRNIGPDSLISLLQLEKQVDNKRLEMDLEAYFEFFDRQVIALTFHGRQIKSTEQVIPLPDQYRVGGARSLRGFREDQFFGTSVAWSNLEYRYILGRRSRVSLFLDSGFITTQDREGNKDELLKLGYGFGFRLQTGLGIMGVDYGLAKGDGFMEGKIHVGLVNEF